MASTQLPAARTRAKASTSTGVWLTTLSSALWLHTSVSSGATLRSPTTTARSGSRWRSLGPWAMRSRKWSLWSNFGFTAGSGSSPPAGT